MDRKTFFRTLPGLFAVKEVAKHLAALPVKVAEPQGYKGLYHQIRHGGTIVNYNRGNFDMTMFEKALADLYKEKRVFEALDN